MDILDAQSKDLKTINQQIKTSLNGTPLKVKNISKLHGVAAGLKHGELQVEGNAGDYLGVLNAGATIRVSKNAAKYLADNMTSGTVIVEGNAEYGAGQYCYGGTIVLRGSAGDFTATMNKGATIIVAGDVGDEAGTYMLKGDLVVVGNAGYNFANYLIRGNVYLGGECKSYGHNTKLEPLTEHDIAALRGYFETYQIKSDPTTFKKIVAASEKPFYH
jgi:glutamate synthase domain-containing protein 3